MLEIDFIVWLQRKQTPKKLISDYVSRLKKLEHSISDCDVDLEYEKDECLNLLSLFYKSGNNKKMASLHTKGLPIGKYYISTYKFALKKYIEFKKETSIHQE